MTLVPEIRKCTRCGRRFSWNPDVGQFACPYCRKIGGLAPAGDILEWILKKKKK